MDYLQLKTAPQFLKFMKEIYFPKRGHIQELTLSPMNFLGFEGKGSPETKAFQDAVQSLYTMAFTLKMGMKFKKIAKPRGYHDYKVPPLEGLWWMKGPFDLSKRNAFEWQLLILLPAFVTKTELNVSIEQARQKKPELPLNKVALVELDEGPSIQTLHVGPYSAEPETIAKLMEYAKEKRLTITGKHHEIYMSDPRRTPPQKLKTILRYPVKT